MLLSLEPMRMDNVPDGSFIWVLKFTCMSKETKMILEASKSKRERIRKRKARGHKTKVTSHENGQLTVGCAQWSMQNHYHNHAWFILAFPFHPLKKCCYQSLILRSQNIYLYTINYSLLSCCSFVCTDGLLTPFPFFFPFCCILSKSNLRGYLISFGK
jgi:hypothetical protein